MAISASSGRAAVHETSSTESPGAAFPIVRDPPAHALLPVLVSIPHYGTGSLPGVSVSDYSEPRFSAFPYGYVDAFARDIYGALHECGATVVATPFSRLFVDVNRARDDYELQSGAVRSTRGVVRTHIRDREALFRDPLRPEALERRLARFYDPYHALLAARLERLRRRFGHAVVLDAHTASATRLGEHEVVIGTRRGRTCSPAMARDMARIVRRHGFACSFDVPGYSGGHTVRRHGSPDGAVQALQIEFNATAIMGTPRDAYAQAQRLGAVPAHDAAGLARCIACMREAVRWLGRRA